MRSLRLDFVVCMRKPVTAGHRQRLDATLDDVPARQIVRRLYALRMQVEEAFRDAKAARVGWALEFSATRSCRSMSNLLLIVALAHLRLHRTPVDSVPPPLWATRLLTTCTSAQKRGRSTRTALRSSTRTSGSSPGTDIARAIRQSGGKDSRSAAA